MTILVTGGAGYIGSVVAAQLVAARHEVTDAWHFIQSRSYAPDGGPAMGVRQDGIPPGEASKVALPGQW